MPGRSICFFSLVVLLLQLACPLSPAPGRRLTCARDVFRSPEQGEYNLYREKEAVLNKYVQLIPGDAAGDRMQGRKLSRRHKAEKAVHPREKIP